jgi:hypothetical protein
MYQGSEISSGASIDAVVPDPAGHRHVLQFGDVRRFYKRSLAVDVSKPIYERYAASKNARTHRQVHAQAADFLGHDGISQTQSHMGGKRAMTKAPDPQTGDYRGFSAK